MRGWELFTCMKDSWNPLSRNIIVSLQYEIQMCVERSTWMLSSLRLVLSLSSKTYSSLPCSVLWGVHMQFSQEKWDTLEESESSVGKKNVFRWLLQTKKPFQHNFRILKVRNYMTCTALSSLISSNWRAATLAQRYISFTTGSECNQEDFLVIVVCIYNIPWGCF